MIGLPALLILVEMNEDRRNRSQQGGPHATTIRPGAFNAVRPDVDPTLIISTQDRIPATAFNSLEFLSMDPKSLRSQEMSHDLSTTPSV